MTKLIIAIKKQIALKIECNPRNEFQIMRAGIINNKSKSTLPENKKLSLRTKLVFAVGGIGNAVGTGTIIPFWYTFFLTDIARLDLGLISLFWVIVTIWDAALQPLIGYLSDRTYTRWGRRRPFLLFGAVPFGLFFTLLWRIPPIQNQALLFAYYLLAYILFVTAASTITGPYTALAPELTQDHDERTSLSVYQSAITLLASIIVPFIFGLSILPNFPEHDPRAFQLLALICGGFFILTSLMTFFFIHEPEKLKKEAPISLKESIQFVISNIPFRYVLVINILGWMPITIVTSLFAYYLTYWVGLRTNAVSFVQGGVMISTWLFLPFVQWLSSRFEKKSAYIFAAGSWSVLLLSTLLIPQGAKLPVYFVIALSGLGIAAIHLLPSAMLPDVIEVDELASQRRQEGIYFGISALVNKLG